MPPARLTSCLVLACVLGGCATFPELDAEISEDAKAAEPLQLADNRTLLSAGSTTTLDLSTQAALQARTDALKSRATGLAGPVVSLDEQQALQEAGDRLQDGTLRVAPET